MVSRTVSAAVTVKSAAVLPEYDAVRLLMLPSGRYAGVSIGMVRVTEAGWMPFVTSADAVTISSCRPPPRISAAGWLLSSVTVCEPRRQTTFQPLNGA